MKLDHKRNGEPFALQLMTCVKALHYDFRTRTGLLHMPGNCCTDMSGCIKLFKAIDADVVRIDTYCDGRGGDDDSIYIREDGEWRAYHRRGTLKSVPIE